MSRLALPALLACLLLVTLALAGCSAGALAGEATGSTSGTSASSGKQAPTNIAGLTGLPTDCLTAPVVSGALGVTVGNPIAGNDAHSVSCTYLIGSSNNGYEINYETVPAGSTAVSVKATILKQEPAGTTVTDIPGYGQAAFDNPAAPGGAALIVWNGGVQFSVVGGHSLTALENLAKTVLAQ